MLVKTHYYNTDHVKLDEKKIKFILERLRLIKTNFSKTPAPHIKEIVLKLFKEEGWTASYSVDEIVKHHIAGIYRNIALVTQFGNMAMCHGDLLKLQHLYNKKIIDYSIYVTFQKKDVRARKENYANLEKLFNHINLYTKIITVPVVMIGLAGE